MFNYELNPFSIILDVVNKLYPAFTANISFLSSVDFREILKKTEHEKAFGMTLFDTDSTPLIIINSETPAEHCVEIIAHEVSHVVAGLRAGHGKKWEKEFNKIHEAYCKLHGEICEKIIESENPDMAKDKNIKKETKKAPQKTKEQKRQEKREKKNK